MSEKLKFYKGLEENLVNITIELGAIYHCTDTGNTYIGVIDLEGEVLEDGTYPLKLDLYSTVSDIYIGDDEIEGGFELVNADTLGGFPADEYALKSHVYEKIDEININSYATKEEVNALTYENVGAAPAGDYATESFVTNKIAEAQLGGGDDTPTIDLSGYATKDDLSALDAEDVGAKIANAIEEIETGGTGATTALQALINLGITDKNIKDFTAQNAGDWENQVKQYILENIQNRIPFIFNVGYQGRSYGTAIAWKTAELIFVIIYNMHGTGGVKFWKYESNAWNNIPVAIDCGGTGATSSADARTNLGITPANIGAFPASGGTITGETTVQNQFNVANSSTGTVGLRFWQDGEGGNIRAYSPSGKTTDYWEMDTLNGDFRIITYKNSAHSSGAGFAFPITLYSDGSIGTGNAAKTRERLGIPETPTGSYTGNNSTALRQINTTSTRDWVAIWSTYGTIAMIGPKGGWYKQGTTLVAFPAETAYTHAGAIFLTTNAVQLNGNGYTYTYTWL